MSKLTALIAASLREMGLETSRPDGRHLTVTVPTRHGARAVAVQVKDRAQALAAAEAEAWVRKFHEEILALPSVPRQRAKQYRAAGINFVDSGGNAHLDFPGFQVWIEGRKPRWLPEGVGRSRSPSMNPAGLRVVFALLVNEALVLESYDEIAAAAGVSKGSASNALVDLRRRGYIHREGRYRTLVNRDLLAEDWITGYVRDLRPRLQEAVLFGPRPGWWLEHALGSGVGTLGGAVALAHMGGRIRPEDTVVYGKPPWGELKRFARLSREGEAQVILRERFWGSEAYEGWVAPPLLAYADALASGDPRSVEVARALAIENRWEVAQ